MKLTASAPGKLLLLGDHAVVYGHPCLVTAVDLRYRATIERCPNSDILIETPALNKQDAVRQVAAESVGQDSPPETAFVEAAVARFFEHFNLRDGLAITTSGPTKSFGLGSSSAVTVATVAALAGIFEIGLTKKALFDLAYQAVLDVQGTGSGFDVAAAVYGGTLYYMNRGERIESLEIDQLPLVIGYSGAKVGTVNLVKQVAGLYKRQQSAVNGVFDLMHQLVDEGRGHLLSGNWRAFGELANLNQGLLDGLGVNTLRLALLIDAARSAGALGAKLSGAGGGDCMFAVYDTDAVNLATALIEAGGEIVPLSLHAPGVAVEG
jgi:mevalonate kinase